MRLRITRGFIAFLVWTYAVSWWIDSSCPLHNPYAWGVLQDGCP